MSPSLYDYNSAKNKHGFVSNVNSVNCVDLVECVVVMHNVDSGTQSHLLVPIRLCRPLSCVAISQDGRFVAAGEKSCCSLIADDQENAPLPPQFQFFSDHVLGSGKSCTSSLSGNSSDNRNTNGSHVSQETFWTRCAAKLPVYNGCSSGQASNDIDIGGDLTSKLLFSNVKSQKQATGGGIDAALSLKMVIYSSYIRAVCQCQNFDYVDEATNHSPSEKLRSQVLAEQELVGYLSEKVDEMLTKNLGSRSTLSRTVKNLKVGARRDFAKDATSYCQA
ncbi:hypothetical protein SDJN03_04211, partial [Cucurbita argyrosperma subsp. sororia]